MKQFIAFVHKEFYHIFRDIRTMMILLGMPIIEIIIFGFALSTDIKDIRVNILNPNEDIVSRKIIERIDASEYFIVDRYLHTSNEIEKEFKEGKADMVIVFSEQFSSKLLHTGEAGIQIIADATDPNTAKTFTQYAASIIAASQQELTLGNNIPMHITSSIKLLYNPQMKSAYNFVPGVMGLILMLICAMMTSISIVREKEMGTMEVLLVSPMRPIFIILAKAVPYFLCKLVYHTYFISLRFACSYCRQLILADYRISPFHFRIIISRIVDLDFDKNTGSGYAGFGNDINDAYHVAFRNDIPDRKYASHTTMDIAHHSGKMVYNDRKKTDDRRGKCLSCMARNINSHVYVHNINYYKSKEI